MQCDWHSHPTIDISCSPRYSSNYTLVGGTFRLLSLPTPYINVHNPNAALTSPIPHPNIFPPHQSNMSLPHTLICPPHTNISPIHYVSTHTNIPPTQSNILPHTLCKPPDGRVCPSQTRGQEIHRHGANEAPRPALCSTRYPTRIHSLSHPTPFHPITPHTLIHPLSYPVLYQVPHTLIHSPPHPIPPYPTLIHLLPHTTPRINISPTPPHILCILYHTPHHVLIYPLPAH